MYNSSHQYYKTTVLLPYITRKCINISINTGALQRIQRHTSESEQLALIYIYLLHHSHFMGYTRTHIHTRS